MTGTEKQIKRAEDLIADARGTISANIKINEERSSSDNDMFARDALIWGEISRQFEDTIAHINSAAQIINTRDCFCDKQLHNLAYMLRNQVEHGKVKIKGINC
jgi:hypothetical protein